MSNKKCVREKYLYLSAMLRAREAKMLTREKAERMIDTASFDEAAKMLADCGYEDYSGMNAKQVDNALAERKTVSLYNSRKCTFFDVLDCGRAVCKHLICGCRNIVLFHKVFRKHL